MNRRSFLQTLAGACIGAMLAVRLQPAEPLEPKSKLFGDLDDQVYVYNVRRRIIYNPEDIKTYAEAGGLMGPWKILPEHEVDEQGLNWYEPL